MKKEMTLEQQVRHAYVKDTITALMVAGILICVTRGLFSFLINFLNSSLPDIGILFYIKTILVALVKGISFALPVFIYGLLSDVKIKDVFLPGKYEGKKHISAIIFVSGTVLVCSLSVLFLQLSHLLMTEMSKSGYIFYMDGIDAGETVGQKIFYILTNSLISAAFCEFFIRGVAVQRMKKDSYILAVFLPALIYAANHPTFPELPVYLFTGIVLGWMLLKTNNIYLVFVSSFIMQAFIYTKSIFLSDGIKFNQFEPTFLIIAGISVLLTAVVLVLSGIKIENRERTHFSGREVMSGFFGSFGIYVLVIAVFIQFLQWHIKNPNIEVEGMEEETVIVEEQKQ